MELQALKDTILLETLANVPFDGWTDLALRAAAVSAGLAPEAVVRAFPGGIEEVFEYFSEWADRAMEQALAERDGAGLPPRDQVALAIRLRLEALAPYREAMRRAIAFAALPQNSVRSARLIYRTIDTIWFAIGDRSVDITFYTKRALLTGVLVPTTLFWLYDDSDDSAATWKFLDRRIGIIATVGQNMVKLGKLGDLARYLPSPVRFVRQLRRRTGTL